MSSSVTVCTNLTLLEAYVPLKHILFEDFRFVLQLKLPAKVCVINWFLSNYDINYYYNYNTFI